MELPRADLTATTPSAAAPLTARLFKSAAAVESFEVRAVLPILAHEVGALAVFGALIAALWFPIAWMLGKRYESVRGGEAAGQRGAAQAAH